MVLREEVEKVDVRGERVGAGAANTCAFLAHWVHEFFARTVGVREIARVDRGVEFARMAVGEGSRPGRCGGATHQVGSGRVYTYIREKQGRMVLELECRTNGTECEAVMTSTCAQWGDALRQAILSDTTSPLTQAFSLKHQY